MVNKVIAGNGVRKTALELARGINRKLLRSDSSFNIGNKKVLNWGASSVTHYAGHAQAEFLNTPEAVERASSKIATFDTIGSRYGVEYTRDQAVAQQWLQEDGIVIARDLDRGNSGRGIVVYKVEENQATPVVGNHRFYTRYFKSRDEYRIHIGLDSNGGMVVIDQQRKGLRQDEGRPENPDFTVRNHDNGFIFARDGVDAPNIVKAVSMASVEALGLHFGAVDVRYSRDRDEAKVLEVNTAPGLTGTTLENYINYFNTNWM